MPRRRDLVFLLVCGLGACHLIGGLDDLEVVDPGARALAEGGGQAGGGQAGGGQVGGAGCLAGACPAADTPCSKAACVNGQCGFEDHASGTPCANLLGAGGAGGGGGQASGGDNSGSGVCDGEGLCVECTLTEHCGADASCIDKLCIGVGCDNSQQDGQETGLDCGGPDCAPCDNGKGCNESSDCWSKICENKYCKACAGDASCADKFYCQDSLGYCEPKKGLGKSCERDGECNSGNCARLFGLGSLQCLL